MHSFPSTKNSMHFNVFCPSHREVGQKKTILLIHAKKLNSHFSPHAFTPRIVWFSRPMERECVPPFRCWLGSGELNDSPRSCFCRRGCCLLFCSPVMIAFIKDPRVFLASLGLFLGRGVLGKTQIVNNLRLLKHK